MGKIMIMAMAWVLLSSAISRAEGPAHRATPSGVGQPGQLDTVLEKARAVPQCIWARIRKAREWVWDEYPDHVLIQDEVELQWPRYLSAALNTPEWLDLGITGRLRREGFDFPFKADQKGSTWQWAHRSRFRASTRWKAFRALLELQGSTSGQDAASDVVGISTFNAGNVQQFFVALTLPNIWQTGFRSDLHVGRINLDIGSRRLVARSRFGNTSQAFDGIHWNLTHQSQWHIRAFFSEIVLPSKTTDRLGLFTNSGHLFWGLSYENHQVPLSRIHLYYFGTDEDAENGRVKRAHSTFGLRLYQPPEIRALDYDGESVWQIGTFDGKDHFAYFQHVSFGYTFELPWEPRIMVMYDYASGTDSANGKDSHTFDGLFGARRGEFTPTGLFGPFYRSNISSPGIRLILNPRHDFKVNLKFRAWYLAQSRDAWTNSGLQDPTGAAGNVLGQDVEVRIQWDPWPNLSLDAGYDHFFKGSYITSQSGISGNPPANDTDTFYFQTEVRF